MTRAVFAGSEAAIGLVVLGLFWVMGFLGVTGVVILAIAHQIEPTTELWEGLAIGIGLVAIFGYVIARDFTAVRVVVIEANGDWKLRGPLGIPRGHIAAGTPRDVVSREAKTWMLVGSVRRYTQSWVEIRANGHTWRTTRSIPSYQARALELLKR